MSATRYAHAVSCRVTGKRHTSSCAIRIHTILRKWFAWTRTASCVCRRSFPIHAGYPLVGKAAWLSHLYTNCYFELSIMTPLVHQGLFHRYMQVMEAVPLSKILFGSDAYNLPELYWLAGRWGKRYLAQALGVYVNNGSLTIDEALEAARMILYKNNRRLHNI